MSKASNGYSGGCQCGAVRYRIEGPLLGASFCHCRMCQKASGNVGIAFASARPSQLTWTRGSPREFRSSARVRRGFCAACGTPLYLHEDGLDEIDMHLGTLDNPAAAEPRHQVGTESKLPWFGRLDALPAETTNENNPAAAQGRYATRQHPDHDTEHWP